MGGSKIALAKQALVKALHMLHPSDRFANYRHLLAISGDEVLIWYRDELIRAEHAARVAGVGRGDLDDNVRMLTDTGAKFVGRALCLWGGEANLLKNLERACQA